MAEWGKAAQQEGEWEKKPQNKAKRRQNEKTAKVAKLQSLANC